MRGGAAVRIQTTTVPAPSRPRPQGDALLQFDFSGHALTRSGAAANEPEPKASIKDALIRWLEQQL